MKKQPKDYYLSITPKPETFPLSVRIPKQMYYDLNDVRKKYNLSWKDFVTATFQRTLDELDKK